MAQIHCADESRDGRAELWRWSLRAWLEWREWNAEFVVWAADTGATLLLPTLAGETLKVLRNGPAAVEDIAARVFSRSSRVNATTAVLVARFAETAADTQRLLRVLNELKALGLARADVT